MDVFILALPLQHIRRIQPFRAHKSVAGGAARAVEAGCANQVPSRHAEVGSELDRRVQPG